MEEIPTPTTDLLAVPGYPDDPERMTLVAPVYVPDPGVWGAGPYPAVIVLHGSGGLWSNDIIANGVLSSLDDLGETLAGRGYLALLPDSYNPRGIPGNFSGRRPHWDPAIDDHRCSPNYERPKDVVATLEYLVTRNDFDGSHIALMGYSQGAQSAMNAVVDESVDLGTYTVSTRVLEEVPDSEPVEYTEVSDTQVVPGPVRIPDDLPFPRLSVFYYGGGSHYGYHGSANDTGAGRFMFDRRTKVLMFHGTGDFLLDVDDPEADGLLTGNLYPMKQAFASSAQADAIGVDDPLQFHLLLHLAEHSFDLESLADPEDWNTPGESVDQKAKRICRAEVLKWLDACLKPVDTDADIAPGANPSEVTLSSATHTSLRYQWETSENLTGWTDSGAGFDGTGMDDNQVAPLSSDHTEFFRLRYEVIPPPIDEPENAGFFWFYDDFDL